MCGIVGFVDYRKELSGDQLEYATNLMYRRGPDSGNTLILNEKQFNVGLGHRRLAIIDDTVFGNQPMRYNGISIIFNGEIYNYQELKERLVQKGYNFETNSDTEVILNSYLEWGLEAFSQFIGMFAIGLYDEKKKEFLLIRDRLGVKPLYIYQRNHQLIFGSEPKTIVSFLGEVKVNQIAIRNFLKYGYIPENDSAFEGVKKVEPGFIYKFTSANFESYKRFQFWNIEDFSKGTEKGNPDLKAALSELLKSSIKYRLVSDVPICSYLSGGLDSSYVTNMMNENMCEKLMTFTMGFENVNDEAPHAKMVAEHIGTKHHEFYMSKEDVIDVIENFSEYIDEPFSDDAILPLVFLSGKAEKHVKVAISSDGGDELFAGYKRYLVSLSMQEKVKKIPSWLRSYIKPFLRLSAFLVGKRNYRLSGNLDKLSRILDKNNDIQDRNVFAEMDGLPEPLIEPLFNGNGHDKEYPGEYNKTYSYVKSPIKRLLIKDIKERLVNQMLVKVDRGTMAASVEGREPLLDHRLFELMMSQKDNVFMKNGKGKTIFKQIVYSELGEELMSKPKMGFTTPIQYWLRNEMKEFVKTQMFFAEQRNIPFINYTELNQFLDSFWKNKLHHDILIWRVLVYIMWYKKWVLKS